MLLRFSIFFVVMSAITISAHVFLYRRLVRDLTRSQALRRAGAVVLTVLGVAMVSGRLASFVLPDGMSAWVSRIGWGWMGVAAYLLTTLVTVAAYAAIAKRVTRRKQGEPVPEVSEERRRLIAGSVAGAAAVVAGGMSTYGVWRAFHRPEVTEVAIRLKHLPRQLDGLTLVQLSDVHVGPWIQRRFMQAVADQVNALKPDALMLTGDLVDGSPEELREGVAPFAAMRARYGTFMVTGNHEYYSGVPRWVNAFSGMGIQVLRNRQVTLGDSTPGGATIDLFGVDDWGARDFDEGGYDLDAAMKGARPDRAAILLAHQPKNFEEAVSRGVGLQLSGHTHGGQMFPMTLLTPVIWDFNAGRYDVGDATIYVSRGTGFWGPPMRVGSPPEIVKIVLTT